MSQGLTGQQDVNNDVVNNNQPEWNKILPRIGLNVGEKCDEDLYVYGCSSSNEKQCPEKSTKIPPKHGESRFSNIQDGLESSISQEGKARVQGILNDVNSLSDVEKLLLYLKLPTGAAPDEALRQTPTSFLHSSNRIEQAQAFTWIRSHLEEDSEICVPKHEVYDDYRLYCESHNLKPLCPADFGKVMKCVFPNVKPRRLGQRGQSKYCYSGLRKKLEVQPPALPELELTPRKEKEEPSEGDEIYTASRQLVCEWAHKLLGGNFSNLRELAEFLVGNLYVNSKSTAAFTVLAAMQDAGLNNSKVPVSSLFTCTSGGNKHKETQLQLQRKLQERELIKEQKRKLQQQRSENERENELLRSQSVSPLVSPFQSPVRNAARNITKLLQSPGVGDFALKSSPQMVQGTGHCKDSKVTQDTCHERSSIEAHVKVDSDFVCGRQSDSGQFHVVKKPSVRQPSQTADTDDDKIIETEKETITQVPTTEANSKEKSSENSHFALPTTPSRSAFVPVSNHWKEQCPAAATVSIAHTSVNDGNEKTFMDEVDSEVKFCAKPVLSVDNKPESKSVSPPSNSDIVISTSSSPHTPKKSSRNRFTPIRPKVTPTKTVSVASKDHKNGLCEGPAYDSRPVSTILKEKRAREAQEILAQIANGVQLQSSQVSLNSGVSQDILKLPLPNGTQSNEVFIIVESPKPGGTKANGAPSSKVGTGGLELLGSSQFPPNVTVPVSQSAVPLALLLARQDDAFVPAGKRVDSSSLDNSDLSDYGNVTDSEMLKSDESQDMVIPRDVDTPSGRKRKSTDREIECKTKRLNATDIRNDEDDVFLPQTIPLNPDNKSAMNNYYESSHKVIPVSGSKLSVESLESDALLDNSPMAVDQNLVSSVLKPTLPATQTASIGVNANSLRPTQKQLMKQKLQLDQRVNNFFNKSQKSSKDVTISQQMKMIDKTKMERLLHQYVQQQQKTEMKSESRKSQSKIANNQPVNLLSLLQQPVFDSKKVFLTTLGNKKTVSDKSEELRGTLVSNDLMCFSNGSQNSNVSDSFESLESSDLPSDVADFITENMMAVRHNPVASSVESSLGKQLHEIHTFSVSTKVRDILQRENGNNLEKVENRTQTVNSGSDEQFTVPSTPPLPRQKSDSANTKLKHPQVQRSSSLPVFAPLLSVGQGPNSFMSLGKGLDMPAPPNRVIDSMSPQPVHQKSTTPVNFSSPGQKLLSRSRHTSLDRPNNQTPMSDAGYHSFDASPIMNSTPISMAGGSDNNPNNVSHINKLAVRPDSAESLVNDVPSAQSPLPQTSPLALSSHSTPSSVVSPQRASQSSVNVSPCENLSSPNSFMPIKGSLSSSCSPLSPQLVTPIKPLVTVAVSPAATTVTSTTFSSGVLMQRNPQETTVHKDSVSRISHNRADKHKESKGESCKTGVLEKLLNSTTLPSYEEAVNKLGQGLMNDKEVGGISKTYNYFLTRSISQPEPEVKRKLENNQIFSESMDRSTAGPDGKAISTSEYPFSYQLALLREKCLNPSGKENIKKDDNDAVGQSVQLKPVVSLKSADKSTMPNDNNMCLMDTEESRYSSLVAADSTSPVLPAQRVSRANVTHHHYGTSSVTPRNSKVNSHTQSKVSATTLIRPSANSVQPRTFSSNCVPSVSPATTVTAACKHKLLNSLVFPTTDLPNVNYMGNAPNIDLGSILQSKQSASVGDSSSDETGGERRQLTLMQALQPTQTINEDELQSTLEILRSLDSQYFSQSDLDLDTMQPCIQPPAHLAQSSPTQAEIGEEESRDQQGSKRSKYSNSSLQSGR